MHASRPQMHMHRNITLFLLHSVHQQAVLTLEGGTASPPFESKHHQQQPWVSSGQERTRCKAASCIG
jgi:hypothetical protein